MYSYREITDDDMDAIFAVRVATWDNDHGWEEMAQLGITPESVRGMIATTHRGWLCEVDGKAVGFAMGNQATGEMWVIAVLKEFEGNGIGKHLLGLVEDWLFSHEWNEIWLTTDRDETIRAIGFYRHLGWEDWKMEPEGDRFMRKVRASTS